MDQLDVIGNDVIAWHAGKAFLGHVQILAERKSDARWIIAGRVESGRLRVCYLAASTEEGEARDPKAHHAEAQAGKIADLTGVAASCGAPQAPEIALETESEPISESPARMIDYLERHFFLDTLGGGS